MAKKSKVAYTARNLPFNQVAHEAIIAAGYDYQHVPAEYWDCGDAENGPAVDGHEAYDMYTKVIGEDSRMGTQLVEYVCISANDSACKVAPEMNC